MLTRMGAIQLSRRTDSGRTFPSHLVCEKADGDMVGQPPKPGAGTAIIGEVSSVDDDASDNLFLDAPARFPAIVEDEPPKHLLCEAARGPNADRREKHLKLLTRLGSGRAADSHSGSIRQATCVLATQPRLPHR
jgi:hypothetical protein